MNFIKIQAIKRKGITKLQKTPANPSLFELTWPIFAQTFLNFILGFVGTFMLSRYSDNAVGAIGFANQITYICTLLLGMIGSGSVILISQNLGANKKEKADVIAAISVILNLLIGILLSIFLFLFRTIILRSMNCPDAFMEYCLTYLGIVGGAIFIQALFLVMSSIMLSYGHSRSSMIINVGVSLLNILGNYLIIFRPFRFIPELGITGIAIMTVINQFLGTIVLYYVLVKKVKIKLSIGSTLMRKREQMKDILSIGVPASSEQILYNLSQFAMTFIITFIGATALNTRVYANSIMWMIEIPVYSLGIGTQIVVARLIGDNKKEEANTLCFKCLKVGFAITISFAILVFSLSKYIYRFFTNDEDIITLGVTLLFIAVFIYPGKVMNIVIGSCLRAAGDVKFPVYLSIIFMWFISIPLAYVFGIHLKFGLAGIWCVFLGDELIRGFIMLWRWKSRKWAKKSFLSMADEKNI